MWKLIAVALFLGAKGLDLPGSCSSDQYYDPGLLKCQSCPANASMVTSTDGFSCTCDAHSVPSAGAGGCKPCSATEVVSADRTACVPRKCQTVAGRVACRRCPAEYITVTQNFDGSPMKEVQCIKCARGYKAQGNACVRCDHCTCNKSHVIVRGTCIPKVFVNARPTYEDKVLHPLELLNVVKHEYFCTGTILLAVAIFSSKGVKFLSNPEENKNPCRLPLKISIGKNWSQDCTLNVTAFNLFEADETRGISPYLIDDGEYKPLHIKIRKPNGYYVQKGSWSNEWFNRYFIVHNFLSTVTNATNTIFLRVLLIRLRIHRYRSATSSLRLRVEIEGQYASGDHQEVVVTTLKVVHELPDANVIRGLEIWGGVLGTFLTLYAVIQWRGVLRRGGLHYSLLPTLAGAAADTLYFSAAFSTLHALAAEAGSLGITLPLSQVEERIIKAFIFSAVALKSLKLIWINWKQMTCDVFFLDWSEYNPPVIKDPASTLSYGESWKGTTLAREWSRVQTTRRVCPGFTVTGAMLFLHLLTPWQAILPKSEAYSWVVVSISWWSSYCIALLGTWMYQRILGSPTSELPQICTKVGISLLVFQEEYYAHYVHGRNEDSKEVRSMTGPLATCRVACVPQLRVVYKQLSAESGVLGENDSKHALLSKFLAAFFERALDGLSWVASERTLFERLLDVELSTREGGNTSALLYDDDTTPSCFAMTWWGEEWNLATLDAMVFSSILMGTGDAVLAAAVTVVVWQVLKEIRRWLGNRNQVEKTHVEIYFPKE